MPADKDFRDRAAIVGVGYSRGQDPVFSRNSGVSVLTLAIRAAVEACKDAGIDPKDLDGGYAYTTNNDSVGPNQVLNALGAREINYTPFLNGGGNLSSFSAVVAAEAVTHGVCKYFLCYRAMNGRSGVRMGQLGGGSGVGRVAGGAKWSSIYGLAGPPLSFALHARRWMERYGVTSEDLGRFAVNSRSHAVNNPRAVMREPITLEDHQSSRFIAEPYHLLDCCQETDVAVAYIVTTAERARALRKTPVLISAGIGGVSRLSDTADTHAIRVAPILLRDAGIERKDIDLLQVYDNFTDCAMRVIEDFGFCGKGEIKDFQKGGRFDYDGELPAETQGGLMNEGYGHGMNNLTEAVMQLRGDAEDLCPRWQEGIHTYDRPGCRQVRNPRIALHCGQEATTAVILKRG